MAELPIGRGKVRTATAVVACRLMVFVFAAITGINVHAAAGQQLFAYPNRGQSADQQSRDKSECRQWASQQTGFDPTAPQSSSAPYVPPPPPTQAPTTSAVQGAARGAAVGAVGGAIGGDAGKGAAIGAATGAMFGGFRRQQQLNAQQAQQQAYQQQVTSAQAQQYSAANAQRTNYNRALAACLQGRGYTVN